MKKPKEKEKNKMSDIALLGAMYFFVKMASEGETGHPIAAVMSAICAAVCAFAWIVSYNHSNSFGG